MNFLILGIVSYVAVAQIEFSKTISYSQTFVYFVFAILFFVVLALVVYFFILLLLTFSTRNYKLNIVSSANNSAQILPEIKTITKKNFHLQLLDLKKNYLRYLTSKKFGLMVGIAVICYFSVSHYSYTQAQKTLQANLFVHNLPEKLMVEGEIDNLPENSQKKDTRSAINFKQVKFDINVRRLFTLDGEEISNPHELKFRVSFRPNEQFDYEFYQGQVWRLPLKIFPASGFNNPEGFNYETWLHYMKINATSYILLPKQIEKIKLLDAKVSLRSRVKQRILASTENLTYQRIVLCLLLGDRGSLTDADWQLFRATGTSHLLAISGMHVGFVATLGYLLCLFGAKLLGYFRPRILLWQPAQTYAFFASIVTAFIYCYLAGFGIPATRAFIVLCIFVFSFVARLESKKLHVWAFALFLVSIIQPFALHSIGFYLSFGTVLLILLLLPIVSSLNRYLQLLIIQLLLALTLIPVNSFVFSEFTLWGWFANLLAIPFVGFVLLPQLLLSLIFLFTDYISYFYWLIDQQIALLYKLLLFLDYGLVNWYLNHWQFMWLMGLIFCFIILLFLSVIIIIQASFSSTNLLNSIFEKFGYKVYLSFSILFLLLIFLTFGKTKFFSQHNSALKKSEFSIKVFDVGQGNAILVETQNKTLMYDLGASYRTGFNLVDATVLPYFASQNLRSIDLLVVSHSDNDHSGGWHAMQNSSIKIKSILAGQPSQLGIDKSSDIVFGQCQSGQSWEWDGVDFEIISPSLSQLAQHKNYLDYKKSFNQKKALPARKLSDNDHSCVLKISNNSHSVMLTGDISKKIEKKLLKKFANKLQTDILITPHHGSATSSSPNFIDQVKPKIAIHTVDFRNKYGLPAKSVMQTYNERNIKQLSSNCSGFIELKLTKTEIKLLQESRKNDYYFIRKCKS